ncbi:MAG: TIM44-like domain-containing protein [Clostridia bacterium]|nr:TIM44-like domain-containing protein [Clostridia bacterium]
MSEVLENLIKEDNTFSEAKFKAKVDNVYIKLYTGVMKQDLENIRHFLSDEVYEKYNNKIKKLQEANVIQVYDELNVSDTNIINIEEFEDRFEITVRLLTKYLDYRIAKDTKKFISGNRDVREEKYVTLRFSKIKNAKALGNARKCTGCGANIDLNKNGVCEYCGSVYILRDYDWVLEEIND